MSDKTQTDKEKALTLDKDSRISVVVNRPEEEDAIDLVRVFQNLKALGRVYVWVLILCLVLGICAPLFAGQFKKSRSLAVSVVTLDYQVPDPKASDGSRIQVEDLTAPDGSALDLTQLTSSYVLQHALQDLQLSKKVSISQLRENLSIERILTESSRRQQEVASKMLSEKSSGAYNQLQSVKLTYTNQFVVTLANDFGLPDRELRVLLDRVLAAYNDYLAETYANYRLPGDVIAAIDPERYDVMECLDLLDSALDSLYDYCRSRPASVRNYRSWRDGRSLTDLMELLQTVQEVNVDYLHSYVFYNSIAEDREKMISNYRYQLRTAQTKLDVANENLKNTAEILEFYVNDLVLVEKQDGDPSMTTSVTTDYYNKLFRQQADELASVTALEITINDLNRRIAALETGASEADTEKAVTELRETIRLCGSIYDMICEQMEEVMAAPFYTKYAVSTAAQTEAQKALTINTKNVAMGGAAGAVIGCVLWFLAALSAEIKRSRKETSDEEVAQ